MTDDKEDLIKAISPVQLEKEAKKSMKEFDTLIDSLSAAHEKKKALWKQIYNNAVTDRRNSYIMFTDLYTEVHSKPHEHAIHGNTLAKYMERLNKTNEQLIKLAEIIEDAVAADQEEQELDENGLYDALEDGDK